MINEKYAKTYCCDDLSLIENYELAINDTTQTWECHHRGEILPCGRFSVDDLRKFGLYYNRPAAELIFLSQSDHRSLHFKGVPKSEATKKAVSEARKGVPLSDAHKKAISEAIKGVPRPYLKGVPLSEEHKKAISDAKKGVPLSEATKKAMSEARKGHSVSEATKKAIGKARSKKILQFTKYGEFIKEWQSAREAHRELGISQGNICACCNGKRKSASDYIWRYA